MTPRAWWEATHGRPCYRLRYKQHPAIRTSRASVVAAFAHLTNSCPRRSWTIGAFASDPRPGLVAVPRVDATRIAGATVMRCGQQWPCVSRARARECACCRVQMWCAIFCRSWSSSQRDSVRLVSIGDHAGTEARTNRGILVVAVVKPTRRCEQRLYREACYSNACVVAISMPLIKLADAISEWSRPRLQAAARGPRLFGARQGDKLSF